MSHTPGPWFVEFSSTCGNRIVHGEMGKSGFRDDVPMDPGDPDAVDNLTLAAAAPELLDALKQAVSNLKMTQVLMDAPARSLCQSILRDYAAIIVKATGGAE